MTTLVDYGAGNLTSVRLAFEALGLPVRITNQPEPIRNAERLVFPGVGAAGAAMETITTLGLDNAIRDAVNKGTPFLGICLGTQIIFERSEESGGVTGIGLVPGTVRRFHPTALTDKVPHMGWNRVHQRCSHPLLDGIAQDAEFYFVHSYWPDPTCPEHVIGTTDYAGVNFAAMIASENLAATQFHPEKSGRIGLRLLKNFAEWNGRPC